MAKTRLGGIYGNYLAEKYPFRGKQKRRSGFPEGLSGHFILFDTDVSYTSDLDH